MVKWINTERATIERAKELLANRIADLPIWVRWYRAYDNPHGGGPFGKSKEYRRREGRAREQAVRIVHQAWWEVSGMDGREADAISAKLDRIKRYVSRSMSNVG